MNPIPEELKETQRSLQGSVLYGEATLVCLLALISLRGCDWLYVVHMQEAIRDRIWCMRTDERPAISDGLTERKDDWGVRLISLMVIFFDYGYDSMAETEREVTSKVSCVAE